MEKQLQFIQSCTRQSISTDDLGYMIKWYFEDADGFFTRVSSSCRQKFFDTPIRIREILMNYNEYIDILDA